MKRKLWGIALSVPALLAGTQVASAQEESGGISDIVVTAQKREQRLQDVPISVAALGASDLEANRITSVRDLDAVTPNVTVRTLQGGNGGINVGMRGEITIGSAPGADKGVAVYIDGIYQGGSGGSAFDFADLERIEILKGPQGTLFGRNSTGGAVNITTRGPAGEFKVKQEVTVGNFNQLRTKTRVDSPQWGPLSTAITYMHNEREGDVKNLGAGTLLDFRAVGGGIERSPDRFGDDNANAWAFSANLDLSSNFDVQYKYDRTEREWTATAQGLTQLPAFGVLPLPALSNAAPTPVTKHRPDAVNGSFATESRMEASGHSLIANWRINDQLTVKNTLGFRKTEYEAPGNQLDGDGGYRITGVGVPFIILSVTGQGRHQQWSDEVQIDYDTDAFHLTTGGIWFRQDLEHYGYESSANQLQFRALTPTGVNQFAIPAAPFVPSKAAVESIGGYAQGEFHLTDTLDFVLGGRLTRDFKRGVDENRLWKKDDTQFTFNVGLNFKPTEDMLTYAKYSTGYISGGTLGGVDYAPELAKSWEGGVKLDWLDGKARTNLSVFHVKYEDLQTATSGTGFDCNMPLLPRVGGLHPCNLTSAQILINTGDARANGFELETTWKPYDSLTLVANAGLLDMKFTKLTYRGWDNNDCAVIIGGTTTGGSVIPGLGATVGAAGVPGSGALVAGQREGNVCGTPISRPRWTGNASATWERPTGYRDSIFSARIDGNFKGQYWNVTSGKDTQNQNGSVPESLIVNARVALDEISLGSTRGTIALWGRNITDEDNPLNITDLKVLGYSTDYEAARTYGIDLKLEF